MLLRGLYFSLVKLEKESLLQKESLVKHSALLTTLFTTAMLTMASAPAAAQNLAGVWEITRETGRGTIVQTLTLTVEGSTVTGNLEFNFGGRGGGGGGGGPQSFPVSDGTVNGNQFSFTVTLSFGGNSFDQMYSGTIDGETLSGTIRGGRGDQPFTAKRPE